MIALLSRLAPVSLINPKPINNRFYSVAIKIDTYNCQCALVCLHRLIAQDLHDRLGFPLHRVPSELSTEQLLQLSVLLPVRDVESGSPNGYLTLNHTQFEMLRRYMNREFTHMDQENKTRLWDVSIYSMRASLESLADSMHKRTRILTWSEICKK